MRGCARNAVVLRLSGTFGTRFRVLFLCGIFILAGGIAGSASAAAIYVMGVNRGETFNVVNTLTSQGNAVTFGMETALSDYSGFDQVWDLRFGTALTTTDRSAYVAFLQSGGLVYLSGDNQAFDGRNNSLNSLLSDLSLAGNSLTGNALNATTQVLTTEGEAAIGGPGGITELDLFFARVVTPGSGTLLAETSAGSGEGSLVLWDRGDIGTAPNGVLLTGYDIEIFNGNNIGIVGKISNIPEPTSVVLVVLGSLALNIRRRLA